MKNISENVVVELLRRYGIHAPVTDERYLRHAELDRGYRLTLEVKEDGDRPHIMLRRGEAEASRIVPLTEFAARSMVAEFCEAAALPALSSRARATLAHVLEEAARLFSEEQLASLRFEPFYLRDNDYRVMHVQAQAKKKLRLKKRLIATAHDAGAVFAYRPTARIR